MATHSFILCYHPTSICSSVVRYTLALARDQVLFLPAINVELRRIDVKNGEQLSEDVFLQHQSGGITPVLSSTDHLDVPITDSPDITNWLCGRFQSLSPEKHNEKVDRLLEALHAINYFTLLMRNKPDMALMLKGQVKE
jgi:hypothetical protein